MKDGCRTMRPSGGSGGGLGRKYHLDEIGSKAENSREFEFV